MPGTGPREEGRFECNSGDGPVPVDTDCCPLRSDSTAYLGGKSGDASIEEASLGLR